jgi:hypothetical protein
MEKSKTASFVVPLLTTAAGSPSATVVTVPAVIVAASPLMPFSVTVNETSAGLVTVTVVGEGTVMFT